jgi:hypothetical protein
MEVIQEFCRCGAYRVNQRLISMYVNNSGEMLDHNLALVAPGDTLLDPDQCNFHEAYGKPVYPLIVGGHKTWAGALQFRGKVLTERDLIIRINGGSRLSELEQYAANRSMALGARWFGGEKAVRLVTDGGRSAASSQKMKKVMPAIPQKSRMRHHWQHSDIGHKMCVWAGGHMDENLRESGLPPEAARSFGTTGFLLLKLPRGTVL